MKLFLTGINLLLFSLAAFAQTGSIKGTVKDAKNSEVIIGATIQLVGSNPVIGSVTDVEGNFEITKVPAGVHQLQISYVSYATKTIENVRVEADKTTLINSALEEDNKTLAEVIVKGQRGTNTEMAVITEIKQIEQVAVGISAQQISRSQDRDASQVIRRVPGVSIQDDRFVIVRGLNERYNTVMLNDVITPSTEVDIKSFSFDLIPSSAIDRMLIFKSGAAELPGDFGGGIIKIYTKTIPDANSFYAGISTSYRANTTFRNLNTYQGGKTDWLGFDDGTRRLPSNFPSQRRINAFGASSEPVINRFKALSPYFTLQNKMMSPDLRAQLGFSKRFYIGSKELTNFTNINYTTTHTFSNVEQYRYFAADPTTGKSEIQYAYNDQFLSENTRLGVLTNWAFILNPRTKFEFRNLFNQLGTKETTIRGGYNDNNLELNNYAFRYEQKSIYTGQLSGTHELSGQSRLRWTGGYGFTNRQEPDYRRFTSSRPQGSNEPFRIDVPQQPSPTFQNAARFYSNLTEYVSTGRVDYEYKKAASAETEDKQILKLRAGLYTEYKDRAFRARYFGIVNPNNVSAEILSLPPTQFFQNSNLSSTGLYYNEGTNTQDRYDAQNTLVSGYVGAYIPLSPRFNATLGFRGEYNRQQLQSVVNGVQRIRVDNPLFSPLPSVNASYNLTDKSLFRLAYSMSVNRPEFRELAQFSYYDFNFDVSRVGNPNLKTATIHNADARYEFYPSEGQLISLAAFYKYFINPIEAKINYSGSGVSYTVDNANNAYSMGLELEARKSLSGLSGSGFLDNVTVLLNAALIKSSVINSFVGQENNRSLQGQSPYLINAGIYYADPKQGWQVNLLYNVIGRRIFAVGDRSVQPTIYEMPRNAIDITVTKQIGDHFEIRAGIQDLLNQPFRLIQDSNLDKKITATDDVYQRFRRGSYSTAGLIYKF
ncbi:TonB-dependent receptor domain-containing protein [Larkinella insperata]|uniref:TonB-dependent receptor domain-containing protein n=1 Tax=Larkinella insperata TaxID=332158 RepID=A0ABW3QN27_9BACT|nr:TonB-dependent receptor [Larkinella insperata]